MQAYIDDKDKGLFTFYLEQAELEETLKLHKTDNKKEPFKKEETNKNPVHKDHQNPSKTTNQTKNRRQDKSAMTRNATQHEDHEINNPKKDNTNQKKLIELLQSHKYKHSKLDKFKIILKQGKANQNQLKYHLSALQEEQDTIKQDDKQKLKVFTEKKTKLEKHNPFQRLALCPTNFSTQFEEILPIEKQQMPLHPLKTKSYESNSCQFRKLQKSVNLKEKKQQKIYEISQAIRNKILPKLELRYNSQLSNDLKPLSPLLKSQINTSRAKASIDESITHINSDRHHSPKDKCLYVQSLLYSVDKSRKNSKFQNKIMEMFQKSKELKKQEQQAKLNKEKLYMEIIRQLKFK